MSYPYKSIWINGRFVLLESILEEQAPARTAFEENTFAFICQWLKGVQKFEIQTSGSTGTPKTITIAREQMTASASATALALQLKENSNALVCIDTKYIGGKMMVARCFNSNLKLWAIDPTAYPLQKIPVDQCVNFAAFVPYQVQNMLGSKHPHLLNNPDHIIIGGAPLEETIVSQLRSLLCRCYATYGMTETISHIALRKLNGPEAQENFEVLPGIRIGTDDRSCLVIEAPYLHEKVITNDIVELATPHSFKWLGRWDHVINTGGVKVIPEKIEAALQKIFSENDIHNRFFIHGIKDKTFGSRVVLVMEASSSTEAIEKILNDSGDIIPPYERPKELRISPAFVLTDSGKIDRANTLLTVSKSVALKKNN